MLHIHTFKVGLKNTINMIRNTLKSVSFLLLFLSCFSCQHKSGPWKLESPDKQLCVEVFLDHSEKSGRLHYTVSRVIDGSTTEIMDPSPLGIKREDAAFVSGLEFVSASYREGIEDAYTLVSGKKLKNSNTYNSLWLTVRNREKEKLTLDLRAYDGGVAFRYHFPGESENSVRVCEELSGFNFKDGNFWAHPYDTVSMWTPSYETYYQGPVAVGTKAPPGKSGWAFPILVESAGSWMMVSEAGFDGNYGASHLQPGCENGEYLIRFAEAGEAEGYYENTSHSVLPWNTAWRFIAIGASPASVVETSLPTDLAAPSELDDLSWIKPGRSSWSWWSDSDSPRDYEKMLPFIDLAAAMGWEYHLVDAGWNRMKNGDLEKLVSYADSKNVKLLAWYNSGGKHNVVGEEPRDLMDQPMIRRKEFERISQMGIKGVKVDFFQSDKQEIIKQYLEILRDAAEFGLLVNFHGCTIPKGWRRTWPNLLTMEALKGGECYRFNPDYPQKAPAHLTIIPFTRNAVGPCDYTTGGFSDNTYPHLTTFGFELALPVVIESGIMHHIDTPEQTLGLPSFAVDFLKRIPVTWDNTKYLSGYPGKDVVIARQKGEHWYIGGINGEKRSKEITIDLSLTGQAPTEVELIIDGDGPRHLQAGRAKTKDGKLTITLQPFGGFTGYW